MVQFSLVSSVTDDNSVSAISEAIQFFSAFSKKTVERFTSQDNGAVDRFLSKNKEAVEILPCQNFERTAIISAARVSVFYGTISLYNCILNSISILNY